MNTNRPNIVMIVADDLGYGDLGCFGNPDIRTPHLDRLAGEGLRLTQHYSASPLCSPARAALLTGRYNHRTGALSVESNRGLDRIDLRETTIADLFKAAGYATGMIGKWHNGLFDKRHHPNARGFDEFFGFLNGGMRYFNWILEQNGSPVWSDSKYLTDVFTGTSVDFIKRHRDEPFFLAVTYNAPHSPYEAPEEDVAPFRETGKFNEGVSRLYGMIRRMDAGIGRILETLDACGLTDDTLVLFTSDNGPWLGHFNVDNGPAQSMARYNGPFRGQKQDVLEGGIRVPAILRWPGGLPAGRDNDTMIHFCDWLPTLLSATGIEGRPGLPLDGIDTLSALRGDKETLNPKRFWQFSRYEPTRDCNAAMRDGNWKLVWPRVPKAMLKRPEDNAWYKAMFDMPHFEMAIDGDPVDLGNPLQTESPELFNLADDPSESHNLAEEQPDRLASMCRELENWFDEVNAERRALPDAWPVSGG